MSNVKKRAYDPKKYQARKEAHRAAFKRYYDRNKEEITAKIRDKYHSDEEHKQIVLERNRLWRAQNKKLSSVEG